MQDNRLHLVVCPIVQSIVNFNVKKKKLIKQNQTKSLNQKLKASGREYFNVAL